MVKGFTVLPLVLSLISVFSASDSVAIEPKKIAIAYDVGGRGDNGLNDLASLGLERAIKKLNISRLDVREQITDGSLGDRITRVRFLAKNKYQLIICVGSGYADTVRRISNEFPNTQFAIIDDESVAMTNVSNLSFATEEAIFLAGAALAVKSKTSKIAFISQKSDPSSLRYSNTFAKGATTGNSKVKVAARLIESNIETEVKSLVATGVDQIFSTWTNSDEVVSNVAKLNSGNTPILISGILPDQYFLNFSAGKKHQYLKVIKHYDLAVEQIITAEMADKNILNILNASKGIYGNRYNLKDGGLTVVQISGSAFSAKIQAILANLKSGKVKNLAG
jgi:basic membrane protein A